MISDFNENSSVPAAYQNLSNQIGPVEAYEPALPSVRTSIFLDPVLFMQMEKVATVLSKSTFIPDTFKGKIGDCMIALDLANRMKVSPILLMQTMYTVHGKPGFEGKLLSALVNGSGRYEGKLQYEWKGKKGEQEWGCRAWAKLRKTGETLYGPWVDWKMVVNERWNQPKKSRTGGPPIPSKWMTMPELMFFYRAASYFCNIHDSDLKMGMQTYEEIMDQEAHELIQGQDGTYTTGQEEKPQDIYEPKNKEEIKEPGKDQQAESQAIKDSYWDPLLANVKTRYFAHEKTILAEMATERGMDVSALATKNDYSTIHKMIISSAHGVPMSVINEDANRQEQKSEGKENGQEEKKEAKSIPDQDQNSNMAKDLDEIWINGDKEAVRHACIICDCQRSAKGFQKPAIEENIEKWINTYLAFLTERTNRFNELWIHGHQSAKDYACEKSDCDLTPNGHFKQPRSDKVSTWISNYNAFCNTHNLPIQEQAGLFNHER